MNFAQQQVDVRRRFVGFGAVLLFHVLLVWFLVSGLAKKVVDVVRAPIETKVIEEVKKPPPPPEVVVPPPPKLEAPPPPFIPPPEIQVAVPPPPAPTITATTPTPPPAPVAIAPAPPPVVAAPAPPPAAPAVLTVGVACSNFRAVMQDQYPPQAIRQGIESGRVTVQFTLTANGEVKDVKALNASNPIFARHILALVPQYKCAGQGRDITVQQTMDFTLK